MTIGQVYTHLLTELKAIFAYEESKEMAFSLIEHHLQISRAKAMLQFNIEVPDNSLPPLAKALDELLSHKPLQYVLGKAFFFQDEFFVNPSVLIPRPETEEMVQAMIREIKTIVMDLDSPLRILDIGTGSGIIAIELKKEFPDISVFAMDHSESALDVARSNAQNLKTDVIFLHADILDPSTLDDLPQFDVIVSNPPYVLEKERAAMDKNVLEFEPADALFVPDDDPLLFYKAIVDFANYNIRPGGYIFLEINENYGEEVKSLYLKHGFEQAEVIKDMSGRDRFVHCRSN